jgi:predicted nucleic acid-binding protein
MSAEFVIDPSVLIQGYIRESNSPRVMTILRGLTSSEPDILYAPEFCLVECTNILWKHVRFHGMPINTARKAVEALSNLPLTLQPVISILPRALNIGLNYQLPIYDSLYIALADSLLCPLITIDEKQATAARANNVSTKPITDFAEFTE